MSAQDIAREWGMHNVDAAAVAAADTGTPFHVACALLEMESKGLNIYGHDVGGVFSVKGRDVAVTAANFREFRQRVDRGEKSNGVGPCQITYKAFFPMAEKQGLELWEPLDNMRFGFALLMDHYRANGNDWQKAGTRYNGKASYGVTLIRRVNEWKERLGGAEEALPMGWYPEATKKEIRPGSSDPAIKVVGAILHVDAGNASSLFGYFNGPSGGIESHFHIRKDGTVEQYRDTGREADANYKANSFIDGGVRKGYVSIETQGLERGEWTDAQIASIKKLLAWLSKTHDFPLRKCRNSTDPGVGFHTLFGAPGPWTPVAKSCPGPDRKLQFDRVLVSWFKAAGNEEPSPEPDPSADEWARGGGFPGEDAFVIGKRHPAVEVLGERLKTVGFAKRHDGDGYQPGPLFTKYDRDNCRDFQLAVGRSAKESTGRPDRETWSDLVAAERAEEKKRKPAPKPEPEEKCA